LGLQILGAPLRAELCACAGALGMYSDVQNIFDAQNICWMRC